MSSNPLGHAINRTAIYGTSTLIRSIASLLLLPIYTRYLTPHDYGTIELLSLAIDLVSILIGARAAVGVFRFFNLASSDRERRTIVGSSLLLVIAVNAVGVGLILAFSQPIALLLFGDEAYSRYISLFAISLLLSAVTEICMNILRAQDLAGHFFAFSLLKLATQVAFNLLFIVYLGMGVEGMIYGTIIASLLTGTSLFVVTVARFGLHFSPSFAKKLINFSLPIILSSIGMFFITYGDRYFLRLYHDLDTVGIYSLGYRFGFIFFSLCWAPFSMYWSAKQFDIAKEGGSGEIFGQVFRYINFLLVIAALTLALLSKELIQIMASPEFWSASAIAPVVILAYLVLTWTDFTRFGLLYRDRTRHLAIGTAIGVVVIGIGYLTLIPRYGPMGAAWATLMGLSVRFAYIYSRSQAVFDMQIQWRPVSSLLLLAIMLFISLNSMDAGIVLSITIKVAAILMLALITFLSPYLSPTERKALLSLLRRKPSSPENLVSR